MRFGFPFLLLALCSVLSAQTTWTLPDGLQSTLQGYDDNPAVVDGDILVLPAGTFSWSGAVLLDKAVTLRGTGYNDNGTTGTFGSRMDDSAGTIILDDNATVNTGTRNLIRWITVAGKAYTMDGIEFRKAYRNVTGNAATNVITATAHSLLVGHPIRFISSATIKPDDIPLAGGSGITPGSLYYVRTVPTADTFTISTSSGGAELDFTTDITAGQFIRDQSANDQQRGIIRVVGPSEAMRITRCIFRDLGSEIIDWTDAYGVIDNCYVILNGGNYRFLKYQHRTMPNGTVDSYGDASWKNPVDWLGDRWAVHLEDCDIVKNAQNAGQMYGTTDTIYGGGRLVGRFNYLSKTHLGNHGTETSGRFRGGRLQEFHNNEFDYATAPAVTQHATFDYRSGSGISWGNRQTGNSGIFFKLNSYRVSESNRPWLQADGTKAWDKPDLSDPGSGGGDAVAGDGIFESGTGNLPANDVPYETTYPATITQAGNTITASSAVFSAGMVGRDVMWVPYTTTNTPRTITAYISPTQVTCSGTARTLATPSGFQIGKHNQFTDTDKSWTPDQWDGYTLRTYADFTATSATSNTSVTVAGAGWVPNQWGAFELTRLSDNKKTAIQSNTSDTLTFTSNGEVYRFAMAPGDQFRLSFSGYINGNSENTITMDSGFGAGTPRRYNPTLQYEIRRVDGLLDDPGMGATNAFAEGSIFALPHQDVGQTWDSACYFFDNLTRSTSVSAWGPVNITGYGYPSIKRNRNWFDDQGTTFNGSLEEGRASVKIGLLADRPTSGLTAGVGYWATDQGEWNSTNGATPDGQLYVATGPTTWALHYIPVQYPHPLREDASPPPPDVTAPTLTSASIDQTGLILSVGFDEAVVGLAAAHWSLSGGLTLGTPTGSGQFWDFPITTAASHGTVYDVDYTPGTTEDAYGNALLSISNFPVANNVPAPSAPTRNPGRRNSTGRPLFR